LKIFKIFSVSAAARLYLFLISGGDLENFKIFPDSATTAVFFFEKSAAATAQPIGLHLYSLVHFLFFFSLPFSSFFDCKTSSLSFRC
jgi:hypothetical protein